MKANRVECDQCTNFIDPILKEDDMSIMCIVNAKCKLGKRVMFRIPKCASSQMAQDYGGYFRYCNDFDKVKK